MKTLKKINLLNLSQTELVKREKSMLKGGVILPCVCVIGCTCKYAGPKEGPDDSFYGGSAQNVSYEAYQRADNGAGTTFS